MFTAWRKIRPTFNSCIQLVTFSPLKRTKISSGRRRGFLRLHYWSKLFFFDSLFEMIFNASYCAAHLYICIFRIRPYYCTLGRNAAKVVNSEIFLPRDIELFSKLNSEWCRWILHMFLHSCTGKLVANRQIFSNMPWQRDALMCLAVKAMRRTHCCIFATRTSRRSKDVQLCFNIEYD